MSPRPTTPPIALLPMYDWPECRAATDTLWQSLASALTGAGFDAPEQLTRSDRPLTDLWTAPELLLGQTCGLPYVRDLAGRVQLVATPAYTLPDCAPGFYRSRIIVSHHSTASGMQDLRGRTAAINGWNSQSGFVALAAVTPEWNPGRHFGKLDLSGSHLASLQAVAAGRADVAAIDAVSFALAERHLPDLTGQVRVLTSSPETPGLPLITANGYSSDQVELMRAVVQDVFNAPGTQAARTELLINGAVAVADRTYDPIRNMAAEMRRAA